MKLRCTKCANKWEVAVKEGQRLILCPSCGSLTPVEAEGAAQGTMVGYQFGQLMAVPFALDTGRSTRASAVAERPSTTGRARRVQAETTHAVLLDADLSNAKELTRSYGEQRVREVLAIFERIARFEIARFSGREISGGRRFALTFEQPVDAVAYALNLIETLRSVSREVGVELVSRAGIHFAPVAIRAASAGDVARGAAALTVEGEGKDAARVLRRVAMPNQVLMTREAWDLARSRAAGNDAIPHGTQWLRHGTFRIEGFSSPVELCEAGRIGVAPLSTPMRAPAKKQEGAPPAAAQPTSANDWRTAVQVGAANLLQSVGRLSGTVTRLPAQAAAEAAKGKPPEEQLAGRSFLHYQIDRLADSDETAVVYHARDVDLERDMALKVLRPKFNNDAVRLTRFIREGLSASQISHPNLIEAWAAGEHDGFHYICFERIHGGTLRDLVDLTGPLKLPTALGYAVQAARAVKVAHDRGVIHRNVSPDTLLLSNNGTVKVTELTLAKLEGDTKRQDKRTGDEQLIVSGGMANVTTAGTSLGDPEFIAPEQALDASTVDRRADQYSLGAVLYYLLAGAPPYEGERPIDVLARRKSGPHKPVSEIAPEAPAAVSAVVEKLLARRPEERFAETWQVVAALEDLLGIKHSREGSPAEGTPGKAPDIAAPAASPAAVDQFALIRDAAANYYSTRFQKARSAAVWGFLLLVPLATAGLTWLVKDFQTPMTGLALLLLTVAWNTVVDGLINKTVLFLQLRHAILRMGKVSWALTIAGAVAGGVLAWAMGLLIHWVAVAVVALGAALAYQLGIALPLRLRRSAFVQSADEEVRRLRETGHSEEKIREEVFNACPRHWEEFFEALFGYEAMLTARVRYVTLRPGVRRPKFAAWRDGIFHWARNIEAARNCSLQERQIARAEAVRLKELGKGEAEAEREGRAQAHRLVLAEQRRTLGRRDPIADDEPPIGAAGGIGLMRRAQYSQATGRSPLRAALNGASSLLGMGILAGYLAPMLAPRVGVEIPPQVVDFLKDYYTWGWGGTFKALIVGALLAKNTVGRSYLMPLCSLAGALLLVATEPIVEVVAQPQFDPKMAIFAGFVLMVMGMGVGGFRRFLSPAGFMPL